MANSNASGTQTTCDGHNKYKHMITHVVFDFDGILVDTERLYTAANEHTLRTVASIEFTAVMKAKMMGRKKMEAVKTLLEHCQLLEAGLVTVDRYMEVYETKIDELMRQTEALPGADRLIRHFFKHGIPLGICTGSDAVEFAQKTTKFGDWKKMVPERLQVLCGSDPEVTSGKPSPIPYQVIMNRFNKKPASPANVLVFEDSPNGVASALAAGCTVIWVPQLDQMPQNWREANKDLCKHENLAEILKSLEEFCPEKYGLPTLHNGN